jgi:SM-20-related protein
VSPSKGPGPGVERPPVVTPPEPPHHKTMPQQTEAKLRSGVSLLDKPNTLPAQCVVLDEFLAPQELEELITYTLQHEGDFDASEVISPTDNGIVDYDHRRSRVLMQTGKHEDVILRRIKDVLPLVLGRLGMEEFPISGVEIQITASNNGDFFRAHQDNSEEEVASRYLTFVYFFHREPAQFDGGELRIHDARLEGDRYVDTGNYQTIMPQQNQIVFFPCSLLHEITPVKCRSGAFADSRFTLNGWLHR